MAGKGYFAALILNTSGDAGDAGDAGETRLMLWRQPNHPRSLVLFHSGIAGHR